MSSNHLKQEQLVWAERGNDTAENIYKLKEADAIKFAKEHAQEKSFLSDEAKINLHDSDDRKFVKVKEKKKRERISTRQQEDLHHIGMFGIFLTVMMVNFNLLMSSGHRKLK